MMPDLPKCITVSRFVLFLSYLILAALVVLPLTVALWWLLSQPTSPWWMKLLALLVWLVDMLLISEAKPR